MTTRDIRKDVSRRLDLPPHAVTAIAMIAIAASAATVVAVPSAVDALVDHPWRALAFFGLTAVLQFFAVEVYGSGRIGVAAIGLLASGIVLGAGAAMIFAVVIAAAQLIRVRGRLHRGVFDASQLALSTGAAVVVYELIAGPHHAAKLFGAVAAGLVFIVLNNVFLCLVIGLAERVSMRDVWEQRFAWARFHYLTFGALAYATARGYEAIGVAGLVAFTLPPGLLLHSFRQYVDRTRDALHEAQTANEALHEANAALELSHEDMRELYLFASGLAPRANDRIALVQYAQEALSRLAGVPVLVTLGADATGIPLLTASARVGAVELASAPARDRWERVRDTALPQLATALENAALTERVRETHVATIAALSKSMEAKDGYTGHHTERVAEIAVALAARLGYAGEELEAIEVGALLHDIGKIGIPERILHKPEPLDEEEWALMKQHPLISEYILSDVGVAPIVLQIARSSHERIDGRGYPDSLWGNAIPLPARIVLVADAYDALTSDRPYRAARPPHAAMEEIRAHTGSQFCPRVVEALESLYRDDPTLLGDFGLSVVEDVA